jgi:hypothetical protein
MYDTKGITVEDFSKKVEQYLAGYAEKIGGKHDENNACDKFFREGYFEETIISIFFFCNVYRLVNISLSFIREFATSNI